MNTDPAHGRAKPPSPGSPVTRVEPLPPDLTKALFERPRLPQFGAAKGSAGNTWKACGCR